MTPATVNIAIKRRARDREKAEEHSKRQLATLYREETQEQKDQAYARDKQIAKDIRAYVRLSKRLNDELLSLGDKFSRYRLLDANIQEKEQMPVW